MIKRLIRCSRCNQVIPLFGNFGDFGEASMLPGVEWSSEDLEIQREFFRCLREHPTEELIVDYDTYVSDKPCYESTKVSYFEASNGKQRFLIRRTKEGLGQPAVYELIPGQLHISNVSLLIQESDLRKQIYSWTRFSPFTEDQIQKFIRAFQEEVQIIPPEKFEEEVEIALEGETPLLAYASLKEARWENVLRRCQKDFQEADLVKIEQFIRENKHPNDVLALMVKRKVSILDPKTG